MRLLRLFLFALQLIPVRYARADEGMWLPVLLSVLNEADMKAQGFKLSAADIYNVNQACIKDAVVIFGGGCTGEIISADGLLLTNHHCGFSTIQSHSSVSNDLTTLGYWAANRAEELVNPGLTVKFLVKMEDVTSLIVPADTVGKTPEEIQAMIAANSKALETQRMEGTHYLADVESFFYGNQYFLMIYETYQDIRLVGAPPSSIGKFGGETDNWVWPRHNADFSLFRVYAAPDGKPAPYSADNVPIKAKYHLPISIKGVKEGDFTMVLGFPGSTQEYLSSSAVDWTLHVLDPVRVELRDARLAVMEREMKKSDEVRIQYSAKYATVSNAYKKWKGEILGLTRDKAVDRKLAYEAVFTSKMNENPALQAQYEDILPRLELLYEELTPLTLSQQLFIEGGYSIELLQFAYRLSQYFSKSPAEMKQDQSKTLAYVSGFFKNYNATLDQHLAAAIFEKYIQLLPEENLPPVIDEISETYPDNFEGYAANLFEGSQLTNPDLVKEWIEQGNVEALRKDPAYQLMAALFSHYFMATADGYNEKNADIQGLQQRYMTAQQQVFTERKFYPDANFTMRLTYGKVEGFEPADGVHYRYYTTLDGLAAKHQAEPENEDFFYPGKLDTLIATKNYGRYAQGSDLRTCFIASNHTTGGNSGSPVMNAEGQLIGLNFDRNWEGTMSDINYDRDLCRNISVDIRYVLFVIDKYGGAGYLIDEMTLVE